MFRRILATTAVFAAVTLATQADESDALTQLLINKGIISKDDLKSGGLSQSDLVDLLRKKGVLTAEEASAVQTKSVDANNFATKQELQDVKDEVQAVIREEPGDFSMPKWLDGLYIKGDIRVRYEGFDFDGSDLGAADKKQRNRGRVRLRVGLGKQWANGVGAHVRLATGGTDDPTSTNQTFDGAANKNFNLDRAFISYAPEQVEWLKLDAGRIPNPFVSTQIMFDSDLNFDGIAEKISYDLGEHVGMFWTAGQFVLEEEGSGTDSLLWAFQGGANVQCTDTFGTTLAVGYYAYQNVAASQDMAQEGIAKGNTGSDIDPTAGTNFNLVFDYRIIDIINKYNMEVMELPLSLYWNLAFNVAGDKGATKLNEDMAWEIGAKLGKTRSAGDWSTGLMYRQIEADAAYAGLNDSDFGGNNRRGFVLNGAYQLLDNLQLSTTWLFTENIDNTLNTGDQDFTRWQINAIVKF